jgi:hypothetical protein
MVRYRMYNSTSTINIPDLYNWSTLIKIFMSQVRMLMTFYIVEKIPFLKPAEITVPPLGNIKTSSTGIS